MAPKPKTIKITLKYNLQKKEVSSTPREPIKFKKGDLVEFISPQGDVHVRFSPATAYKPSTFRTGDGPVLVKKSAKGMIWCGVDYRDGSKTLTIDPSKKEYGLHTDTGH